MSKPIHGSCLCGGVKFVVDGKLLAPLNCHCSMCRKAHSAAFRSRAGVKPADFRYVAGKELVRRYESSAGNWRCFCDRCGTRLWTEFADPNEPWGMPLALFDGDPGVRPGFHIMVAYKAPWHEITDTLPQFAEYPPKPKA